MKYEHLITSIEHAEMLALQLQQTLENIHSKAQAYIFADTGSICVGNIIRPDTDAKMAMEVRARLHALNPLVELLSEAEVFSKWQRHILASARNAAAVSE